MAQSQMRNTLTTPSSPAMRRSLPRWRETERLGAALYVALLICLEVIPIQALLLTYAASASASLDNVFGPLWLIVAVLALFALARWRLGSRSVGLLTFAALVIGVVAIVLFIALSPTAYGATPGGIWSLNWLTQLQTDAAYNTSRFNGLFAIAPLVIYLGWRGMILGGLAPRIEVTLRRFTISLAVVMLACLGAALAPSVMQLPLQGALLALLALDVFVGLAAAALARRGAGVESGGSAEATRWLLTAFVTAALVIGVAFALGLIFNFRWAGALLVALGPVGSALNVALGWLTQSLAYLMWVLFVKTLGAWLFKNAQFYVTPPRSVSSSPIQANHRVIAPPPHGLVVAAGVIVGVLVVALVILLAFISVRAVLNTLRPDAEPELDEDREALDARSLLRRQARDLLGRWRAASAPELDPLANGSARWLYRETLRAGAAIGAPRRPGETADEYSQRLAQRLRASGETEHDAGLAALTSAYDDARYGESAAPASPDLIAASRRATAALTKLRAQS